MRAAADRLRGRALPDRVVEAQVIRHALHGRLAAGLRRRALASSGAVGLPCSFLVQKDRLLLRRADRKSSFACRNVGDVAG
jgi:hypothetical protein